MYNRIFDIENRLDEGMFLFGARQVGKSTLLKQRFPQAVYIDLLNSDLRKRFKQSPALFKEMLVKYRLKLWSSLTKYRKSRSYWMKSIL